MLGIKSNPPRGPGECVECGARELNAPTGDSTPSQAQLAGLPVLWRRHLESIRQRGEPLCVACAAKLTTLADPNRIVPRKVAPTIEADIVKGSFEETRVSRALQDMAKSTNIRSQGMLAKDNTPPWKKW